MHDSPPPLEMSICQAPFFLRPSFEGELASRSADLLLPSFQPFRMPGRRGFLEDFLSVFLMARPSFQSFSLFPSSWNLFLLIPPLSAQ